MCEKMTPLVPTHGDLIINCLVECRSNYISENDKDLTAEIRSNNKHECDWVIECRSTVPVPSQLTVRNLEKYLLKKLHYNQNHIVECECYIELPNWRQLRLESICKTEEQTISEAFKSISHAILLRLKIVRNLRDLMDEMRTKMLSKILETMKRTAPSLLASLNLPFQIFELENIYKQPASDHTRDVSTFTKIFDHWYQTQISLDTSHKASELTDRPKSVPASNRNFCISCNCSRKSKTKVQQRFTDSINNHAVEICDSTDINYQGDGYHSDGYRDNSYRVNARTRENGVDFSDEDSMGNDENVESRDSRGNSTGSWRSSDGGLPILSEAEKLQPTDLRIHREETLMSSVGDQTTFAPAFRIKKEMTDAQDVDTFEMKVKDILPCGLINTYAYDGNVGYQGPIGRHQMPPLQINRNPSQDPLVTYINHHPAHGVDIKRRLPHQSINKTSHVAFTVGGISPDKEHLNPGFDRRKRIRVFIDPLTEIPKLESWFQIDSHPSSQAVERLTDELNRSSYRQRFPPLQPKNIHLWFKNHRAKVKRLKHDGQNHCSSEMVDTLPGDGFNCESFEENLSDIDENDFHYK